VLFVDLKKVYDSAPRGALWAILEKCGVPPKMLDVIRSFLEGMYAGEFVWVLMYLANLK